MKLSSGIVSPYRRIAVESLTIVALVCPSACSMVLVVCCAVATIVEDPIVVNDIDTTIANKATRNNVLFFIEKGYACFTYTL